MHLSLGAQLRHGVLGGLLLTIVVAGNAAPSGDIRSATAGGYLGLYPASDFRVSDGKCGDCAQPPAALWYFQEETIAVPKQGAEGFERGTRVFDDVRRNHQRKQAEAAQSRPPILWLGGAQQTTGVLAPDGKTLRLAANGRQQPFALTPKIASNLSYFDDSSLRYFAGQQLHVRGDVRDGQFVARTVWPAQYALDFSRLKPAPLQAGETLDALIRAEKGGAQAAMSARVLWQRDPATIKQWAGKPVLAFVLNGAQGDDDEALGGHFAIATGRFGERGEWGSWIVNNFYGLDSVSEKGIIAASVPLDVYQGDLNAGQSWYRPSYFLVAVLKNERSAAQFQQAVSRVFNHFYRHDFSYHHATANCAGISIGTLRTVGWEVPTLGPTSRLKAIAALPVVSITDRSFESGKKAVDYLMAEQTSLYPMLTFQAAGQDLLTRIAAGKADTDYEKQLAEDLEGIIYVRIPQFPSSRAFGDAPVASIDEYMATAPANRADWKIIPVPPRPFPDELRDPQSPGNDLAPSSLTVAGYAGFLGVTGIGFWHRRRKKREQRQAEES